MNKGADYWKNQMEITRGIKHVTEETRAGCLAYEETNLRAALTASIPLDRLEAICAAEQEGRCAVLPCKVGDTVYIDLIKHYRNSVGYMDDRVREVFVDSITIGKPYWKLNEGDNEEEFLPTDFGKTVFLTRAEAQAAKGGDGTGTKSSSELSTCKQYEENKSSDEITGGHIDVILHLP